VKKINCFDDLVMAAEANKALEVTFSGVGTRHPCPARFILNMKGTDIARMLEFGMYVCEPQKKKGDQDEQGNMA